MMLIRNREDFERRLLKAAHKLDGLGQIHLEYLAEIKLVTIEHNLALMRVPAVGQLRREIFRLWLTKDLAPILGLAFEQCGEEVQGVKFLVSL